MKEIMLSLLTWIGSNTAYDINIDLPNITMTDPANLCNNYGITTKGKCSAANLKGFYNKNFTIYLPQDFNQHDTTDRSRLMHELVHYVQWANNEHKATCLGHLEVEAYELQDAWGSQYQLPKSLDPFKEILLTSSCDD